MQEERLEEQRQVPMRYKKYEYNLHGYRFLSFGKSLIGALLRRQRSRGFVTGSQKNIPAGLC